MSDEGPSPTRGSAGDGAAKNGSGRPPLAEQRDCPTVYGAAEDSHLLATTVRDAIDPGQRALDVGTGSGYVALAMRDAGARVVGVDVNPHACRQARDAGVEVLRGDLLSTFAADSFDVVACNPPYLPTPDEDPWDDWMETALSGGEDGRRLIEPLLEDVERVVTPWGRLFLLVSSLTDIEAVRAYADDAGLESAVVAREKHAYECLVVLELVPKSAD